MQGCIGANIVEKGDKVSGQGGHMLWGQPIANGYFVEAIIFKGKVNYPKDIYFGPHTLIP